MATATIVLAATLWQGRAQQQAPPDFSGEWQPVSAVGTTPPDGFVIRTHQTPSSLHATAHWTEPENGQYGLTLVGLIASELTFSLDGREDLNQAGPFVLHSKTRWRDAHLITGWNTSEFLGMSFEGEWVRSVSTDGLEMTLEIRANSSQGQHSEAVLKLRRK
jgi:hypothetical protein